jgi:hypothetical protein
LIINDLYTSADKSAATACYLKFLENIILNIKKGQKRDCFLTFFLCLNLTQV